MHKCIYLQSKDGKALDCWQQGNSVKKSECTRCLLAYIVGGLYNSPKPKKPAMRRSSKK